MLYLPYILGDGRVKGEICCTLEPHSFMGGVSDHYETLHMSLKVTEKLSDTQELVIAVEAKNDEGAPIILGEISVIPPKKVIV